MELLSYFGKVNLYWILFYACYWLLLRRHTFFQWNRAYLIGSLVISFVLPLLSFAGQAPVIEPAVYVAAAIPVYISTPASESYFGHWVQFFWAVQALGAALMLSKLVEAVQDLRALIREGEVISLDNCTLVLLPHSETGSFSFLNWVVINRNDYENHFDLILRHETVHVMQKHSVDILLIELLKTAFWFNPVLWFYKKSFQEVHEFLADEQAPNRDHYTNFLVAYALNTPVASLTNHFFNSPLLLTRIKMIYKNRNSQWSLGKYLIVAPIIGVMVLLTSARERLLNAVEKRSTSFSTTADSVHVEGQIYDESRKPIAGATIVTKGGTKGTSTDSKGHFRLDAVPQNSTLVISHINYKAVEFNVGESKNQAFTFTLKADETTLAETVVVGHPREKIVASDQTGTVAPRDMSNMFFTVVEQKPEFPGGQSALSLYLMQNVVYPMEAIENKVTGEVTVSFIVNEKGYVRSPTVIKGLGSGIDEEAVRVVLNMPKWNPGVQNGHPVPVKYTMPIKFDLTSPGKIERDRRQGFFEQKEMPANIKLRGNDFTFGQQNPLVLIDGVKQKERGNEGVANVKVENIQSISVVKGQSATSMYGEEGKEGVILIQTKKSSGFLQKEPLELPRTINKKYYKNESKVKI